MLAAALALHELHYLIAGRPVGDGFDAAHGYLPLAGGAAALLLGVAGAMLLRALACARRTGEGGHGPVSVRRAWLLATGALLALQLPARAILLHPYDHGLLDWQELWGLPVLADEDVPVKHVRIDCEGSTMGSSASWQTCRSARAKTPRKAAEPERRPLSVR